MLKRIKMLRDEAGISQKVLADAIGVSQQSINKYENHNIEPDIQTLCRLADFFNTSTDYIVEHSEVRRKIEPVSSFDLNVAEAQIMMNYRKLDEKQRDCIQLIIETFNR